MDDENLSDKNESSAELVKIPNNQIINTVSSFNLNSQQIQNTRSADTKSSKKAVPISGLSEVKDDPNNI